MSTNNEEVVLRPSAGKLLESMRDIGYSFSSAIADIVDNSISADSRHIEVFDGFSKSGNPFVAVVDDGVGMSSAELTVAMKHGSRSPTEHRNESDLGRFGLGLKTASFSQCKVLTVVSRKNGTTSGRCWDLNRVVQKDEWLLRILSDEQLKSCPGIDRVGAHGTLVLWESLDRLDARGEEEGHALQAINELFSEARQHIALTFHRFIRPDPGDRIEPVVISINGHAVDAFDPFARHMSPPSTAEPPLTMQSGDSTIEVRAYTLPHHKRLDEAQIEFLAMGSSLTETQGFYIYRARRLIVGGGWLGMYRRSESTKLLRVRVDVPNSLDSDWCIDVKKSRIRPPASVRELLRPLVERMSLHAKRPYTYRGQKQVDPRGYPPWVRISERGSVRYAVNRDHPLVAKLFARAGELMDIDALLELLEGALPVDAIATDFHDAPISFKQDQIDDTSLRGIVAAFLESLEPGTEKVSQAVADRIQDTYPFRGDPRVKAIVTELRQVVQTAEGEDA